MRPFSSKQQTCQFYELFLIFYFILDAAFATSNPCARYCPNGLAIRQIEFCWQVRASYFVVVLGKCKWKRFWWPIFFHCLRFVSITIDDDHYGSYPKNRQLRIVVNVPFEATKSFTIDSSFHFCHCSAALVSYAVWPSLEVWL